MASRDQDPLRAILLSLLPCPSRDILPSTHAPPSLSPAAFPPEPRSWLLTSRELSLHHTARGPHVVRLLIQDTEVVVVCCCGQQQGSGQPCHIQPHEWECLGIGKGRPWNRWETPVPSQQVREAKVRTSCPGHGEGDTELDEPPVTLQALGRDGGFT